MIFFTLQFPFGRKFVWVSVSFNCAVHCEDRVVRVGVSECIWSIGGMTLTGGIRSTGKKICPTVASSSTNALWTGLWLNQVIGARDRQPAAWNVTRTAPHSHFIYEMTLTWWLYAFLEYYSGMTRGQYLPVFCPPMQKVACGEVHQVFFKQALVSKT